MAINYGSEVAQYVDSTKVTCTTGGWTALQVGSQPLKGRRHLHFQIKAAPGGAVALAFANADITNNARGVSSKTFTAPTVAVKGSITYPGNAIVWLPVGENVAVYGRLVQKKGFSDGSVSVAVAEYK
jgi:hypothetical protein